MIEFNYTNHYKSQLLLILRLVFSAFANACFGRKASLELVFVTE